MRPVATTTRTEGLQNSQVERCGVGRVLCWSSGTGASVTGKGGTSGFWGWGGHKQVADAGTELFPAGDSVFMLRGMGGKWCAQRVLSKNAASLEHALR